LELASSTAIPAGVFVSVLGWDPVSNGFPLLALGGCHLAVTRSEDLSLGCLVIQQVVNTHRHTHTHTPSSPLSNEEDKNPNQNFDVFVIPEVKFASTVTDNFRV
jgi:hypothetical protein